ncbi:hypothetical protein D3C73_672600 [compost metagenome]
MDTVAEEVPSVTTPPVTSLNATLNVSVGSTRLSSLIGTVKVKVAPAAEFAGKVKVPLVAVKSVPEAAVPFTVA